MAIYQTAHTSFADCCKDRLVRFQRGAFPVIVFLFMIAIIVGFCLVATSGHKAYVIAQKEKLARMARQCSTQPRSSFCDVLTLREDVDAINVGTMSLSDILQYFQWPNSSSCALAQHFGGSIVSSKQDNTTLKGMGGQKAVCLHPPQLAPPVDRCLVYSFGVNGEWSFDETMEAYGCRVFSFDPSMNISDQLQQHNRTDNIHFFRWALGNESSDNWKNDTEIPTKTLEDIFFYLSGYYWHEENAVIDYLKLDIEWAEWIVLPQILESGMMNKVKQLAVEIHLPYKEPYFHGGQGVDQFRRLFKIVRSVENYGMVRFDSKRNIFFQREISLLNFTGPMAYQIAWYNSRFL